MLLHGMIYLEMLPVRLHPVPPRRVQGSVAHHVVKAVFKSILDVGVPFPVPEYGLGQMLPMSSAPQAPA